MNKYFVYSNARPNYFVFLGCAPASQMDLLISQWGHNILAFHSTFRGHSLSCEAAAKGAEHVHNPALDNH